MKTAVGNFVTTNPASILSQINSIWQERFPQNDVTISALCKLYVYISHGLSPLMFNNFYLHFLSILESYIDLANVIDESFASENSEETLPANETISQDACTSI